MMLIDGYDYWRDAAIIDEARCHMRYERAMRD